MHPCLDHVATGILAIGDKNAIQRMILTLTFGIVSRPKVSVGIRKLSFVQLRIKSDVQLRPSYGMQLSNWTTKNYTRILQCT